MKLQSKVILNSLIKNFINYGFISHGAMNLSKERKFCIKELIDLNLIEKRNCKYPHIYELTEDVRKKLIETYDLENLWGVRKDNYEYHMFKYRIRPNTNKKVR